MQDREDRAFEALIVAVMLGIDPLTGEPDDWLPELTARERRALNQVTWQSILDLAERRKMAEYQQCEPFGIDAGELDDLSPQQCFVLGYELAQVHRLADHITERDTEKTVHAANRERIEAALCARGRQFSWTWPHDDQSEAWVFLTIHANQR